MSIKKRQGTTNTTEVVFVGVSHLIESGVGGGEDGEGPGAGEDVREPGGLDRGVEGGELGVGGHQVRQRGGRGGRLGGGGGHDAVGGGVVRLCVVRAVVLGVVRGRLVVVRV